MPDLAGPLLIAVAPNGARKTHRDHPKLPLTAQALAEDAEACLQAGASMLHLHVRNADTTHSLDAELYRSWLKVVESRVGEQMLLQITTESGGLYEPQQQRDLLLDLEPRAASIAVRELFVDDVEAELSGRVLDVLIKQTSALQIIVYSEAELLHWYALQQRGVVPDADFPLLLVIGRYAREESVLALLQNTVSSLKPQARWMCCAFGEDEYSCLQRAAALGGAVRVGFENQLYNQHGRLALNNAELVQQMAGSDVAQSRGLMTVAQTREFMQVV